MHKFGADCLETIIANLVFCLVCFLIGMELYGALCVKDVSDILLQKYEDLCLYSVDILCPK